MRRMRRSRSCLALTYGLDLGLSTKVLAKSPGQRQNFSSGEKSNSRLETGEDGLLGMRDLAVVGRVGPAVVGRPWMVEPAKGDRGGEIIFAVPGRLAGNPSDTGLDGERGRDGVRGRDVKSAYMPKIELNC